MITAAIAVGTDGAMNLGAGPTYGILLALLFMHGCICSAATKALARLNLFYAFVTCACHASFLLCHQTPIILAVGTTVGAIIALLVCAGENRVSTKDAFTKYENYTGWSNGLHCMLAHDRLLNFAASPRGLGISTCIHSANVDVHGLLVFCPCQLWLE